jgi:hypothetical protein
MDVGLMRTNEDVDACDDDGFADTEETTAAAIAAEADFIAADTNFLLFAELFAAPLFDD